jgi:uncharacterized membrane protein YcfT
MSAGQRLQWVDTAKGLGIVLVVFMHATLGVEKALDLQTMFHSWVLFAQPFRMPDFFVISGLFLHRTTSWPLARFVDRKILHFVYFYLLWYVIQAGLKFAWQSTQLWDLPYVLLYGLLEPFGTLWFIYVLALCMAAVSVAGRVPRGVLLAIAIILNLAHVQTGWTTIDEFCARFVYVVVGLLSGPWVLRAASGLTAVNTPLLISGLAIWAIFNWAAVALGVAEWSGLSLLLGLLGAGAVIVTSVLLTQIAFGRVLVYLGERSLPIYLAFFAPMALMRVAVIWGGGSSFPSAIALGSTAAGVMFPLLVYKTCKQGPLRFLFARPCWARLEARNLAREPHTSGAAL